ncbi:hypothetical protein Zmor_007546 [Zophobas morio]|uniref:Uncharacterized protein n=1 Tax=Zophobas morio TaxID=2755281 RepID=A0AA38ITV4_9CUCU|nr:hypothetical protein Zmor_007546 [Zophobas morio]
MQNTQEECGYGGEGRAKAAASPTDHKQHQVRENGLLTVYVRNVLLDKTATSCNDNAGILLPCAQSRYRFSELALDLRQG